MTHPLNCIISCTCGTVKATINSPSALRLICYCVDCRGYYHALQARHEDDQEQSSLAPLRDRGGVDHTQIYPCEMIINEGMNQLQLSHISLNYQGKPSTLCRIYAKCCNTPLYNHGSVSLLVNTNIIPEHSRIPIRYEIMGRMALPENRSTTGISDEMTAATDTTTKIASGAEEGAPQEPATTLPTETSNHHHHHHHHIPNSVPFGFPFVMMGRAARGTTRKTPVPWELPDIAKAEVIDVHSELTKKEWNAHPLKH